jgi:hypothetical protein
LLENDNNCSILLLLPILIDGAIIGAPPRNLCDPNSCG